MQTPLAENLFTWPDDEPHLLGGQCLGCGVINFPVQSACPGCSSSDIKQIELKNRGTLWTWTTQEYPPKSPPFKGVDAENPFQPFAVGYIELAEQVRVESRLTICDPEKLKIGMEMELVIVPFVKDKEGNEMMMFAFQPINNTH